jgi:Protein of unknown function (DUF5818)
MPRGTLHLISGFVDFQAETLVLRPEAGGCWELDCSFRMYRRLRQVIGQQVLMEGKRIDFNALYVQQLWEGWSLPPLNDVRTRTQ